MCHIQADPQYLIYKDKDHTFVLSWQLGYILSDAKEKFEKPNS
jgi:hypothetical protein